MKSILNKSVWNKEIFSRNIESFKARFPSLFSVYENLAEKILSCDFENPDEMKSAFPFWDLCSAKNGSPVASENGLRLHSFYNPEREAEGLLSDADRFDALCFESFGLGYAVVLAAEILAGNSVRKEQLSSEDFSDDVLKERFSEKKIIILESEPLHFFASLCILDWTKVFRVKNLVLALSCPPDDAIKLINQSSVLKTKFIAVPSQTNHDKAYFSAIQTLVERNRKKEEINLATTKKFGKRWNENCIRNARNAFFSDGAEIFKDCAGDIPFLILAAGPSLNEIIPHLNELSGKCVTVAVDTSLRSLLKNGFQPDFVMISDPQYYAYRHLAGLSAPDTILVASQDVYPSVFRFRCRKIICSKSQMPIGKFFESFCGEKSEKADLGSGGSVASVAWNFSRLCGAKKIYLSGLDLSFPQKQTHIKGSTFEQAFHFFSKKTDSAETKSIPFLFSGNAEEAESFSGGKVMTDQRMKMFAWWFESRISETDADFKSSGVSGLSESFECYVTETFTLNPNGLKIPGVKVASLSDLLNGKDFSLQKKDFFKNAEKKYISLNEKELLSAKFEEARLAFENATKGIDKSDFYKVKSALEKNQKFLKIF